jgi:hypothetical protein
MSEMRSRSSRDPSVLIFEVAIDDDDDDDGHHQSDLHLVFPLE